MVLALKPLHEKYKLRELSFQLIKLFGAGKAAMDELLDQTKNVLAEKVLSQNFLNKY